MTDIPPMRPDAPRSAINDALRANPTQPEPIPLKGENARAKPALPKSFFRYPDKPQEPSGYKIHPRNPHPKLSWEEIQQEEAAYLLGQGQTIKVAAAVAGLGIGCVKKMRKVMR